MSEVKQPGKAEDSRDSDFQLAVFPWLQQVKDFLDVCGLLPYIRPQVVHQDKYGYHSPCQVLLMPDALVCSNEYIAIIAFSLVKQISIVQSLPSPFPGSVNMVAGQVTSQGGRNVVVE